MARHERALTRSEIVAMVERMGGWVERRGRHLRVHAPDGKVKAILPTSGELYGRKYMNTRADLKRAELWDLSLSRGRASIGV